MMELWSWILAAIGVTGIFFVGKKVIWAWLILLINECIWIAYALATDQYGFIVMATAYAAVYIKSYLAWKKEAEKGVWL
jgi:nicotinamide riboside transporter PnuC